MRYKRFSDQIRDAISGSKLSRYRICADIRLDQATLSRFMNGKGNLSLETIDRLAELLKFRVVVAPEQKPE
jgi:transcriptional regulator with XRE-family HTH domain